MFSLIATRLKSDLTCQKLICNQLKATKQARFFPVAYQL